VLAMGLSLTLLAWFIAAIATREVLPPPQNTSPERLREAARARLELRQIAPKALRVGLGSVALGIVLVVLSMIR
jgi:hypothetical protein